MRRDRSTSPLPPTPRPSDRVRRILAGLAWAALASSAAAACEPRFDRPELPAPGEALQRPSGPYRHAYRAGDRHLVLEVLDDDVVRVSTATGPAPEAIATTPMIARADWPGPDELTLAPGRLETAELVVTVAPETLAVSVDDRRSGARLTTLRPTDAGLAVSQEGTTDVYGLGEQLSEEPAASWLGRVRAPGSEYGNRMVSFARGAVGDVQIPILYALGEGTRGYALFVDEVAPLTWDLSADPWTISKPGGGLRTYVIAGPDLPDLRRDYMALTGRPPVPPRSAFGLWVSEYGYRDWRHVDRVVTSLEEHAFPLSGVVLDLFWYGGIEGYSPDSRMGSLRWAPDTFGHAREELKSLRDRGVDVMVIEQSYVSKGLPEYGVLSDAGYLVRDCAAHRCAPVEITSWWGQGSMIDWTNPTAGDFWHDYRRVALVEAGVAGHWTDLGEPEDFDEHGWYHGMPPDHAHTHRANANLYNFAWLQSISRGYERADLAQRPFIMSRSGTAGVQRFGAALWSGDIASNDVSLRAQMDAQLHMSLSGIDYYGSDVGGFHRSALERLPGPLYTRWLAASALTDVPVRPHTMNLQQIHDTAPDRIGHVPSNLANVRLRDRLVPYLYSLAHVAHRRGDAVFPPLVYYFQADPQVRGLTTQKMLGPHLMAAVHVAHGQDVVDVYLPAGTWYDYRTGRRLEGGRWLKGVPVRAAEGRLELPLYARAGAVLPERDREHPERLVVRVFPGEAASGGRTTLYEDDGRTVAYLDGAVRETRLAQVASNGQLTITVGAATGTFDGAPDAREVQLLVPAAEVAAGDHPVEGGWVSVLLPAAPVAQARAAKLTLASR